MKNTCFRQYLRYFIAINKIAFGCVTVLSLLAGCVAAPGAAQPGTAPAAVQSAQQLEQRAAQAFTRGEWADALADYQAASGIYASLAMTDAQLRTQLSMARVEAESGQTQQALKTVESVLQRIDRVTGMAADASGMQGVRIQDSTRLVAHGRAAALLMATDPGQAQQHWRQARQLCGTQCPQLASLLVLQARMALQQGDAAAGWRSATEALQARPTAVERANALRVRVLAALQLRQLDGAAADAQTALQLDQGLGLSARVVEDLRVLVAVHRALGDSRQALYFQGLLTQAESARRALQDGASTPSAGAI